MAEVMSAMFVKIATHQTKGVAQLVFEIPSGQANEALRILGGYPDPEKPKEVALSLLPESVQTLPAEKVAKHLREGDREAFTNMKPAKQAALLCKDPMFWRFLNRDGQVSHVGSEDEARWALYAIFGICSRTWLNDEPTATSWRQMEAEFYVWKHDRR